MASRNIKIMGSDNTAKSDDWRRQGQTAYLTGVKLIFRDYQPFRFGWDHDHCEFCGTKLLLNEGGLNKGYSTEDGYYWICTECFNDFKEEFDWKT